MKSKKRIDKNGNIIWELPNGDLHREDGPAVVSVYGDYKGWYLNGKRHREDGPAVTFGDYINHWYINGIELSEAECKMKIRDIKLKMLNIWQN